MEACKNCLHYEVCQMHYKQKRELTYATEREVRSAMIKAQEAVDIECDYYKDRSRFVELPQSIYLCDAVYFVLKGLDEIDLQQYTFTVGENAVSDTVQL